jgi:hypothetical protein
MAKFDPIYFERLCEWIRKADNGWYYPSAFEPSTEATDIEKFFGHLKWYELKNKDDRYVGIKDGKFRLGDIFYPGCMAIGNLPEETRIQKMNRMWKDMGESRANKEPELLIEAKKLNKGKNNIYNEKGLFD